MEMTIIYLFCVHYRHFQTFTFTSCRRDSTSPNIMLSHKTSPGKPRYKHIVTTFHDLKQSFRRIRFQTAIQCIFGCCFLCIFYAISISIYHRHYQNIPPIWSPSTPLNLSISNTSTHSQINDDLNINHLNLSQLNMMRFVKDWGKTPTTRSPTPSPTSPQSVWNHSLSKKAPHLVSNEVLKDIVISNVVWDLGSCGCTGWGIETVNIIEALSERLDSIKLITDYDCWCPGFSDDTLVGTYSILCFVFFVFCLFL